MSTQLSVPNPDFRRLSVRKRKWLKKYTKLEYIKSILEMRQLYLGNPADWDDQNDGEAIRIYAERKGDYRVRATCLTQGSDRFHFWHIFGERERGICLWFDFDSLDSDIKKDSSLIARSVRYPNEKDLVTTKTDEIPFTKREQYVDEREYRVIRVQPPVGIEYDQFFFSANSLRRIYLNPWLSPFWVRSYKCELSKHLQGDLQHVELKQNRSLRMNRWIEKLNRAPSGNS